jgi:hypothetical protein
MLAATLAIMLLCCLQMARGQEASPSPKPETAATQEVSAAKQALIKQILDLTNSRVNTEAMFNAQFTEMEKHLPEIEWQAISSMDEFKQLTPVQKEEVRQKLNESSAKMSKRLRQLFLEHIDMKQMVEDISYSVYDKHFSEAELADLLAFYKSATGQKVIAEMPGLFAESIAKASEMISPKIKEIVEETQKVQTQELTQQIDMLIKSTKKTPAKKSTPSRRRH